MEIAMPYTQARYRQALLWYWLQQHRLQSEKTLLNNLLAYWKLDETSSTRFDSTPNNNDLTDNNTVGSATGKVGNAALFDGSNYLTVTNPSLNITGAISIAGWVYAVDRVTEQHILGGYSATSPFPGYGLGIGIVPSNTNKWVWYSGAGWIPSTSDIALNTWTHIAFTLNSTGTLNIYLNGALDRTTTASIPSLYSGQKALGARSDDATRAVSGTLVDEFGIWGRELSDSEIAGLYNSGSGLTYPFV
jgi:hypothetical protein